MQLTNSFIVPLPPEQAWPILTDIPRIAPSMPGAELTEVIDDRNFKGRMLVRLGPMMMAFGGSVAIVEADEIQHRARVRAEGAEQKGRGTAEAEATFYLSETPEGSRVVITTDLRMTGAVAQFGRSAGVIQAAAATLTEQFADNLQAEISRTQDGESQNAEAATKPISLLSLLWRMILHMFGR